MNTGFARNSSQMALWGLFTHVLQGLWEMVNAGSWYTGSVEQWETATVLNCRSCEIKTGIRCYLRDWVKMDLAIGAKKIKCSCGGELTRDSALIKVA